MKITKSLIKRIIKEELEMEASGGGGLKLDYVKQASPWDPDTFTYKVSDGADVYVGVVSVNTNHPMCSIRDFHSKKEITNDKLAVQISELVKSSTKSGEKSLKMEIGGDVNEETVSVGGREYTVSWVGDLDDVGAIKSVTTDGKPVKVSGNKKLEDALVWAIQDKQASVGREESSRDLASHKYGKNF